MVHQRTIKIEISLEKQNSAYGTNARKTNFPTQCTLDGVVVFLFL
jgi:hypothetical protein